MASVKIITPSGASAGSVELADSVFGIEPNMSVMHQVVTAQLAARRGGNHSTLTRAEVRGGGAKPWRQKGTGRARAGSIRAPHWRGGGVAHGPKPRDYSQKTPKKMVRLALRSALSDRAADERVLVVDAWAFDAPKTSAAVAALEAIGASGKVLVVLGENDTVAWKSFRNLPMVHCLSVNELNTYDVLESDYVVFTSETLPSAEAEPKAKAKAKAPAAKPAATPAVEDTVVEDTVVEDTVVEDTVVEDTAGSDWAGSVEPPADGSIPEGFEIKGNKDSMKYHQPDGRWYSNTVAEVFFDTTENAEAAGFVEAGKSASSEEGDES